MILEKHAYIFAKTYSVVVISLRTLKENLPMEKYTH